MAQLVVEASPLPPNFRGTPQQFLEALVERLRITTDLVGFVLSDTMPGSNQGPWLREGRQIWVWDEDTSQYVPLDISPSLRDEIWVGDSEPPPISNEDPTPRQRIWLRTQGTTVLGLYWWAGSSAGWVTKASDLQPSSVTATHIQSGAISTDKIADLAVTAAKLQNALPVTKLAPGGGRQFLRTTPTGGSVEWATFASSSPELTIVLNARVEHTHGLGVVPSYVRAVLVCKTPQYGYSEGTEVDLGVAIAEGNHCTVYATDQLVGMVCLAAPRLMRLDSLGSHAQINLASWRIKFYYGTG